MILSKENDFVTNNSVIRKNQEPRTMNEEHIVTYHQVMPNETLANEGS